ncbi:MAG: NAD(P)-dependent oxidoreductase [Bacteroidaceae bacterium]|nr:NAD(P)-dependent oxidoreductase [Bacteroidaceae bacterium]
MKILVTGASGFIGSFLCEEGLRQGHEVWAGVRRSSSRRYLQDERLKFAELDFSSPERLSAQLAIHKQEHAGWEVVIHCAGVTKCPKEEDFERNNYLYTRLLVEGLMQAGMTPRQFVYLSSLSVFGPIREEVAHADFPHGSACLYAPITEHDTPCPNTAYGRSKLRAEQYLQGLGEKLPTVIFRPTGVYGPREKDYFLMAKSIQGHTDFSVGFRRQEITFIYVKDLASAIYRAVQKGVAGRAYFVSDGGIYESRTFSDLIQRELGNPWVLRIKSPLWLLKLISYVAGWGASIVGKTCTLNKDKYQIMKQRNWQCDTAPLKQELGWEPQYDLERGVRETIAWYKQEKWL